MAPVGCIFQIQLTGFTKDEKMWTRHESHTTFVLPMLPSDYCFCLALNAMICQWTPTIVFQGVASTLVSSSLLFEQSSSVFIIFSSTTKKVLELSNLWLQVDTANNGLQLFFVSLSNPDSQEKSYRKQEFCILGKKDLLSIVFKVNGFFTRSILSLASFVVILVQWLLGSAQKWASYA